MKPPLKLAEYRFRSFACSAKRVNYLLDDVGKVGVREECKMLLNGIELGELKQEKEFDLERQSVLELLKAIRGLFDSLEVVGNTRKDLDLAIQQLEEKQ